MLEIRVEGKEELEKKLQPENTIEPPIKEGIKEITIALLRESMMATPVDTGRLRSSITYELMGEDSSRVGTNVEYAPFIEFGTRFMEARHTEGGMRVYGEGPFTWAIKQINLEDYSVKIASDIESRWEK